MSQTLRVPAPVSAIRRLLDDVDDTVIPTIIGIGATERELFGAVQWIRADDLLDIGLGHRLEGLVYELFKILTAEEHEEDRQ